MLPKRDYKAKIKRIVLITFPMSQKLISVAKISSKGSSLRITIPKEVAEKLNISESEHIGFYFENNVVIVKKIG